MGKKKRSSVEAPVERTEIESPPQGEWATTQEVVIRCPVCGLIVSEKETRRDGEPAGILSGPYEIKVGLRSFGGSFPKSEGGRRRGFIGYEWDWPDGPAELEKWTDILKRKLQEALEEFGS